MRLMMSCWKRKKRLFAGSIFCDLLACLMWTSTLGSNISFHAP
ncbi:hypothetical protein ACHAWF_016465 [Thalassiosira exigua]